MSGYYHRNSKPHSNPIPYKTSVSALFLILKEESYIVITNYNTYNQYALIFLYHQYKIIVYNMYNIVL